MLLNHFVEQVLNDNRIPYYSSADNEASKQLALSLGFKKCACSYYARIKK